jgi:hypothetical protein
MCEHFVLLVEFNMPAHHDDRLAHKEHKEPTDQGNGNEYDTGIQDLLIEGHGIEPPDHLPYKHIVRNPRQSFCLFPRSFNKGHNGIHHVAR